MATMPSIHQWLAVLTTAENVAARCAIPSHRHRLELACQAPNATRAAQAMWMEGMAAY